VATVLSTLAASTQVRVEIRAVGHYGDDTTFETGPFSMVINVENGRGSGVGGCTAPAVVVGACPQPGQSNVQLCK
jgi:hypothetical protein